MKRNLPALVLRSASLTMVLVLAGLGLSGLWHGAALPDALAARAPVVSTGHDLVDVPAGPDKAELIEAIAGPAPVNADPRDPPGSIRLPKPVLPTGPRRVGLQAGHWLTAEAPVELGRIVFQTGTSWAGITEVSINLDIAERVAAILQAKGVVVDILPTTVPPGYLADAFVAIHGDGDGTGQKSGFKMARSTRRTPFEAKLMEHVIRTYGDATDLDYDVEGISRNMLGYYAMAWSRIKHSTSPFTPSVLLEMGFVSNDWDRHLMVNRPDLLAGAIAQGILAFLDENPREKLFGSDLVVSAPPERGAPPPQQPR